MLRRVLSIVFIFCSLKCNCEDPGYYTMADLEKEGSASGDGGIKAVDFNTWLRLQEHGDSDSEEDYDEELGSTVPGADCDKMLDITFILDASESIGPVGFRTIKYDTKQILNNLDLDDCDNVGIIKFTDFANSETFLGIQSTKKEIFARIDDLEEPERIIYNEVNNSRIALALLVADKIVFTKQLGSRSMSEKFVVLMTDGRQPTHDSSNRSLTVEKLVKKLNKKGIRILVLAVGENPSIEELVKLTKDERDVFPERRLSDLMEVLLPKKKHPNVVLQLADFYVAEEPTIKAESNFNLANENN